MNTEQTETVGLLSMCISRLHAVMQQLMPNIIFTDISIRGISGTVRLRYNCSNWELFQNIPSRHPCTRFTDKVDSLLSLTDLECLQVALLWVAQQRGNAMVVSHTLAVRVLGVGEDLSHHRHTAQCTVNKLQNLRITDFLLVTNWTMLSNICIRSKKKPCVPLCHGWSI